MYIIPNIALFLGKSFVYMFWFYFLSSKFSRKLSFVESLAELAEIVPLEQASLPDRVKQWVFYLISWYFSIISNVICTQGKLLQTGKLLHSFGSVLAPWDEYQSWYILFAPHIERLFLYAQMFLLLMWNVLEEKYNSC